VRVILWEWYRVQFFSNMKVGTKILVICLFLAIIPTLLLGLVTYTSSSSVISEQTQALLETQVGDMKGWTNDVYKLTRNKVNSDLNVQNRISTERASLRSSTIR
jgi:hypothetical protein